MFCGSAFLKTPVSPLFSLGLRGRVRINAQALFVLPNVFKGFRDTSSETLKRRPLFSLCLLVKTPQICGVNHSSSISANRPRISSIAIFSLRMLSFSSSWLAVALTLISANLLGNRMLVSSQDRAE